MPVISIIGAPGVGKSFLVRQLACLYCMPAFFEGEEGIFTGNVLKILNGKVDSKERFVWLLTRYKKNLEAARKASNAGLTCFVDGDVRSMEAWLEAETGECSKTGLKGWIKENQYLKADKVLILVASERKLAENRKQRGRSAEMTDFIYTRMLRVQKGMYSVAKHHKACILLDRTKLDFTDRKTLDKICRMLGLPIIKS